MRSTKDRRTRGFVRAAMAAIVAMAGCVAALVSCVTPGGFGPDAVPCLEYESGMVGKDVVSPVDGVVVDSPELGPDAIVIRCEASYLWEGESLTQEYELVIGRFSRTFKGERVKRGDALGKIRGDTFITARAPDLNLYMVLSSWNKPVAYEEWYYYSPDWFVPGKVDLLTFREVESLGAAVDDFYRRWEAEGNEAEGATIHFFPEFDRVWAKTSLAAFPVKATRTSALTLAEFQLYKNPGVFQFQSELDHPSEYRAILYWTTNMRGYLLKEYEPGDDLYVYCNIVALDHKTRTVVVCVSDFTLRSPAEEFEWRLMQIGAE